VTERTSFVLKAALVGAVSLVGAAAFSAYLRPGMLVEFANLILCG
jgi:hypothetical protein